MIYRAFFAAVADCRSQTPYRRRVHAGVVETQDDEIILCQRGQLFQAGGKLPRMNFVRPKG
jgi:hypothetical protein